MKKGKKKAFTLVEVIVIIMIIGIIALIVTPIFLNVIGDSKKEAFIKSAEFYLDAVENSIMVDKLDNNMIDDGTYPIMNDGNVCIGNLEENVCDNRVLYVDASGRRPSKGYVTISGTDVIDTQMTIDNTKIVSKTPEILVIWEPLAVPVTNNNVTDGNVPNGEFSIGDEYIVEVKENTKYHFYIVSRNDINGNLIGKDDTETEVHSVNMIMYANINDEGVPVDSNDVTNRGLTSWNKDKRSDYSSNNGHLGPKYAMDYLHEITKDWDIDNIVLNYDDEGSYDGWGYGGIYTTVSEQTGKSLTEIKNKNGDIEATYENLKARLPMKRETNYWPKKAWLNNYTYWGEGEKQIYKSGISYDYEYSYWLLPSSSSSDYLNFAVFYNSSYGTTTNDYKGVRPVITVSVDDIAE